MGVPTLRRALHVLALAAVLPCAVFAEEGGSADQRFLAGLRERGLYGLAEKYCAGQLRRPDLPEARRAELSIELSLALAERAVSSAPAERPPLWRQAQQAVEDFARQYPASPWLVQVRFQAAINLLARGELARQEAELASGGEAALEEARTSLREAIRLLEQLARAADELRRQIGREGPARAESSAERPSARQIESILENIRYELSRAYRNQGQSYPAGSADRADALNQALAALDWTARLPTEHPLAWKGRIDQVVCCRLLGDFQAARQKLAALAAAGPPPAVALRARAEEARIALAEQKPDEAVKVLSAGRTLEGATSPELDLAILEACVTQWRAAAAAQQKEAAEEWYGRASAQVRLLGREYGPYWMRRGESLLAGTMGGPTDSGDVASLVRAAEGYFRGQRPDEALAAYDRAREAAGRQGARDRAFDLGFIAATIEHQRKRHAEALARYSQLAQAWPDHPKAAQAHELAVQHAAELAKGGEPRALEQVAALLAFHRRTWPRDPGTDRVRWLAARLAEHRRDWPAAIEAYCEITAADPDYAQAVEAAGRAWDARLAQVKAAGKPVEKPAAEAASWFESVIVGPEGRLPERWSPAQQTAALAAARLLLDHVPGGHLRAERILSAALAGAADAGDQWKSDARSLLVYSLAAAGRQREAAQVLEGVGAGKPEQLLVMLDGLTRVAADARPEVRAQVAELQLRAIGLLAPRRSELGEGVGRMIARVEAQALADAGHTEDALAAYRALAERNPRDSRIQEGFAQLLVAQDGRTPLEEALAKWREIARTAPQATPLWFRAQYGVALAHYRLGNPAKAADIIRQLEVLRPDLGGPEMAGKFRELLARCGK